MNKEKVGTGKWQYFKVGLLFEISRPNSRSAQKYAKGNVGFVASGNFNNGIMDYLEPKNENDFDEGNCITVSPVDGYAFYQKERFLGRGGAGSSIMILRNKHLNEYNGCFICTVLRKACSEWTYSNMGNNDTLADTIIQLPMKSKDIPDWKYMEQYMKQVERTARKKISLICNAIGFSF
ncbi:MAG: restriction endonuclease subunit S [Bacteroidales bacterium]|nr:restriction endonuclease subunit S [Bacteroidales bacterium]